MLLKDLVQMFGGFLGTGQTLVWPNSAGNPALFLMTKFFNFRQVGKQEFDSTEHGLRLVVLLQEGMDASNWIVLHVFRHHVAP